MKLLLIILTISLSIPILAQTVNVEESQEMVNGDKVSAVKTTLKIADSRKVEKQWISHLRNFGKVQNSDGMLIIEEAIIEGISAAVTSNVPVKSYSRVTLKEEGTEIWWAIENDDKFISNEHDSRKYERAKKILHQFGVDVYINEINEDIVEADRVIDNAAREYDRLLRESSSLEKKMEKNGYEKIKLEEKLVENMNDSIQLSLQMIQNNEDQENALKEIDKLKQARESIRGKLEEVK